MAHDQKVEIREVTPEISPVYAALEAQYGRERIELLLDMLGELAELPRRG